MTTRPKQPSVSDAGEQLQLAMSQIDEMAKKLDEMKAVFNESAKQVANTLIVSPATLPPAPTHSDAVTIPVPALPKRPTGRYSMGEQAKAEQPLPPPSLVRKPSVPRPDPRPAAVVAPAMRPVSVTVPAMSRKQSGRFYIQLDAQGPEEIRRLREEVTKLGRVVDSGLGTAMNPAASWIEVAVQAHSTRELIDQLRQNDLKEHVVKVIEVEPGEGRLQARQMDLFRAKMGR